MYGFFGINVVYHFFFFSFFFCLVIIFLVVDNKLRHLDFLFHSILIFKYFKFCFGKIRLIRIFLQCDVFFSVFCGYYWYDAVHFVQFKPVEYFGNFWFTNCDLQIQCSGCKWIEVIAICIAYHFTTKSLSGALNRSGQDPHLAPGFVYLYLLKRYITIFDTVLDAEIVNEYYTAPDCTKH